MRKTQIKHSVVLISAVCLAIDIGISTFVNVGWMTTLLITLSHERNHKFCGQSNKHAAIVIHVRVVLCKNLKSKLIAFSLSKQRLS